MPGTRFTLGPAEGRTRVPGMTTKCRSPTMQRLALFLFALGLAIGGASAQADANWPDKPIRFVVPFPAGSFADITMRVLQQRMGPRLGQQLVIDNRSGASGNIGM